jgi:hypothetical protein
VAKDDGKLRTFDSGATRDTAANKIDPEGFLDPFVIATFSEYMNRHRIQSDGGLRDSDNWQKGFTRAAIIKSLWRHFLDVWLMHRGNPPQSQDHFEVWIKRGKEAALREALCGILFNAQAYLRESLRNRNRKG